MLIDAIETIRSSDIKDSNFDIVSYLYNVPQNANDSNKIVLLLSEVNVKPLDFGSNQYGGKSGEVQLQIFYPRDYEDDCEGFEDKILTIMENNDWYYQFSRIDSDPSTERLFSTIRFEKRIERRNR